MKKAIILWICLVPVLLFGQSVQYDVEESVSLTEQKYKETCRRVGKVDVYVIQVVALSGEESGSKAQEVVKSLNAFLTSNDIHAEAYTVFSEPNHKVKIGNFTTRHAAYGVLMKVIGNYPGAFVTRDSRKITSFIEE
ncbi:MAG: SPOR domain-containing protein [Bacteroidales bacterium]|jgi:hypothetical protein|nr:SPOR domain-containing protein [Bacteroidales bacterium]